MQSLPFRQVDVFAGARFGGNPVAVVLDAHELSTDEMQRFARWTNLSETTFVLAPTAAGADYRVRIFTPDRELPFAGHPTLGTCHAWLESGGVPADPSIVIQQCDLGLIPIQTTDAGLAFEAPPVIRGGAVSAEDLASAAKSLGLAVADVVASQWVDNGPGWLGLLLQDDAAVLAVKPSELSGPFLGIVGMAPAHSEFAYEVRAFFNTGGPTLEDPITGSLNASVAQWLISEQLVTPPYRVRQGTALGCVGEVSITQSVDGAIWVGGMTTTRLTGHVVVGTDRGAATRRRALSTPDEPAAGRHRGSGAAARHR